LRPIGVLLSCMPRVLCDVLSNVINEQCDMAVMNHCVEIDALLKTINQLQPDVVVLGLRGPELSAISELVLRRAPALKIVAVEDDGRCASLVELGSRRTTVVQPSVQGFLQLIRFASSRAGLGQGAQASADMIERRASRRVD
jgi:hypothetical protein